ncbi:MAG: alpha-glucan family phosphorylase [Gemmatimonadota bacterium]
MENPGTRFCLEVRPWLPPRLARLAELAGDLYYSWDLPTRGLFARLDPALWDVCGHSPKAFLNQVDQRRLEAAAEDPGYLGHYNRVVSAYDTYLARSPRHTNGVRLDDGELVAYFCFEFGFHESLPIYSGGLGILAGDHCKAAADAGLPFVGVGLLYRQGYFTQEIDSDGNQRATYHDADFDDLPVSPARTADGAELHIPIEVAERTVLVKVWQTQVGRVKLVLLDTDLPENSDHDRFIVHRLYGGDRGTRIEQEVVLGIGGVRALRALNLQPTVWHINEGHAAFLVLERVRECMERGVEFAAALEAVAARTVFTTHTAVPAGHDHFTEDMIRRYFQGYCSAQGIDVQALLALGRTPASHDFNMTALALRGSRHRNGVSRIHGGVSANMLRELWPQVPPPENPISYVTNGVHAPTFLAPEWIDIFDRFLGPDWSQRLSDRECWQRVHEIPDHIFWSVRQYLKAQMLQLVAHRIRRQVRRAHGSEAHADRLLRFANPTDPNVLTIGFARRFATYKRATLLFDQLELLDELVNDEQRPLLFVFAGKAHPADFPGQELMRRIAEVARMPRFEGKILLVEGYDLRLARRLTSGVDVWLNHPTYPLEACGTSGMKAAMNGVLNLSIRDGWWDEGYAPGNGWAITPIPEELGQDVRNRGEMRSIYEILQDRVIPLYYSRGPMGHSPGWVTMAKESIATLMPRFNTERMLTEYVTRLYAPAANLGRRVAADDYAHAHELARWKQRVYERWPAVRLRRVDESLHRIAYGEGMHVAVEMELDGLAADDVIVELLIADDSHGPAAQDDKALPLSPVGAQGASGVQRFELKLVPERCGRFEYRIRAYPRHPLLAHRFELGLMLWV